MGSDSRETVDKESMLSRWSRRKLAAGQPAAASAGAPAQDGSDLADAPGAEAIAEQQAPLTDADMPDVDSLREDSDFSGFMSPGVSDELRNLALRKLFHAPVFNIRDGLDDYDDDYTGFEQLGDIVTSDMKHQIEVQQRKLREALEQENQASDAAGLDDVESIDDDAETDSEAAAAMQPQQSASAAADDPEMKTETRHE
jgi:hypothetical protein